MYNAQLIQNFFDKVNKEAELAAQKVYDQYQEKFEQLVLSQLKTGDQLNCGMGMASIRNKKGDYITVKLTEVLTSLEYTQDLNFGFATKDIVK